jgi:hypothetical protein
MKLTKEQSQKLLRERGIWITAACDRCRQLLGAVRWTTKGEPGEWCSAACRDGVKAERPTSASIEVAAAVNRQQQKRIGSRPSGRPRTHATNAEKQRSYRGRLKNGLALRNAPSEHIENAQLADAKNGSCVARCHPGEPGARSGCSRKLGFPDFFPKIFPESNCREHENRLAEEPGRVENTCLCHINSLRSTQLKDANSRLCR